MLTLRLITKIRRLTTKILPGAVQKREQHLRIDQDGTEIIAQEFEGLRAAFLQELSDDDIEVIIEREGKKIDEMNTRNTKDMYKKVFGLDIVQAEAWRSEEILSFTRQNIRLIKSIHSSLLDKAESLIFDNVRRGVRAKDISEKLEEQFDITKNRAKLIARDQVGKFNSNLNKMRFTSLGSTGYKWRDSGDNRVRVEHKRLADRSRKGEIFSWNDPPLHIRGESLHPGEDIQCRCWAEPIFEDEE